MDGWTDGRTFGPTEGWIDRRTEGLTDIQEPRLKISAARKSRLDHWAKKVLFFGGGFGVENGRLMRHPGHKGGLSYHHLHGFAG